MFTHHLSIEWDPRIPPARVGFGDWSQPVSERTVVDENDRWLEQQLFFHGQLLGRTSPHAVLVSLREHDGNNGCKSQ